MSLVLNLAVMQVAQVTLLVLVAALASRVLAPRWPRLMSCVWLVVLLKSITPPLWASPTGVFSWAQASAVSGQRPTSSLLAPDWIPASPGVLVIAVAVGVCWLAGVAASAVYAFRGRRLLASLLDRDELAADHPLAIHTAALARELDLVPPARVVVSRDQLGPAVAGVRRTALILPETLVANQTAESLRPVLLHELVHTTRRDTAWSLLLSCVRAIWWFHPLVRWGASQADNLVERCVDLTVVCDLKTALPEYARGLMNVLELRADLKPRPELASLRPCQITAQRLGFLRNVGRNRSGSDSLARRGLRFAAGVTLAALLLPAAPLDVLCVRCEGPAPSAASQPIPTGPAAAIDSVATIR
jgi:beta-lactamase regulating signal transducer with metallopeptidase domain